VKFSHNSLTSPLSHETTYTCVPYTELSSLATLLALQEHSLTERFETLIVSRNTGGGAGIVVIGVDVGLGGVVALVVLAGVITTDVLVTEDELVMTADELVVTKALVLTTVVEMGIVTGTLRQDIVHHLVVS
jgi:hypothetical protein